MDNKQKILEALDVAIDDIKESRLLDILLDAYKDQKRQIAELKAENSAERESMYHERESMKAEHRRMREDPLYCASGNYYFVCNGRRFVVSVQGFKMEMFEQNESIHHFAQQLSPSEFNK